MRRPGSQSPPDERKSPLAVGASSWIQHVWIQLFFSAIQKHFFRKTSSRKERKQKKHFFPCPNILHKQYIIKIPRTPYFNIKC